MHSATQDAASRLDAALEVAEAEVEAALSSSGAAAALSVDALREESRLLSVALAAKDRALAAVRDTLQSAPLQRSPPHGNALTCPRSRPLWPAVAAGGRAARGERANR